MAKAPKSDSDNSAQRITDARNRNLDLALQQIPVIVDGFLIIACLSVAE